MKWEKIFIGQIVMSADKDKQCEYQGYLPVVGKVVDISFQYDVSTIIHGVQSQAITDRKIGIQPVVHFLGEGAPREINIVNIEPYEG